MPPTGPAASDDQIAPTPVVTSPIPTANMESVTPTVAPSATSQPSPAQGSTVPPTVGATIATPLPIAQYLLREGWSADDANNVMVLSTAYWAHALEIPYTKSDALNPLRKHFAILAQEALWRFPELSEREAVAWSVAFNLAVSGDQSATPLVADLVAAELDQSAVFNPTQLTLRHAGFTFIWTAAPDLFGDGRPGWLLEGAVARDSANGAGGGAVWAIDKVSDRDWDVKPIYSYWQPYFAGDVGVDIVNNTAGNPPEVVIHQEQAHGMGWSMREAWVCSYRWASDRWTPLLAGMTWSPDVSGYILPITYGDCLVFYGGLSSEVTSTVESHESGTHRLQFMTPFDPYNCGGWMLEHSLVWRSSNYQHMVSLKPAPDTDPLVETQCVSSPWEFDPMLENSADVIDLLNISLAQCDDSASMDENRCLAFMTPGFRDKSRFHLARLYALTGSLAASRELLEEIVNHPTHSSDLEWSIRSRSYLDNLDDLAVAEQALSSELWPATEAAPHSNDFVLESVDQARNLLFDEHAPDQAELVLRTALASQDWMNECADTVVDDDAIPKSIELYWENECASVIFLLGVISETDGRPQSALELYWRVWRDFPDSVYAIVASTKLVDTP